MTLALRFHDPKYPQPAPAPGADRRVVVVAALEAPAFPGAFHGSNADVYRRRNTPGITPVESANCPGPGRRPGFPGAGTGSRFSPRGDSPGASLASFVPGRATRRRSF